MLYMYTLPNKHFLPCLQRFHMGKAEAPCPGTYNDPRTALEGLRRVTGLKHSPFGQTSVRFQQQGRPKRTPGKQINCKSMMFMEPPKYLNFMKKISATTIKGAFHGTCFLLRCFCTYVKWRKKSKVCACFISIMRAKICTDC